MAREQSRQDPIVMVIDFHHARGPEIELCIGDEGTDPATENDWSLLPFMALSDGAHASTEEFSYFTLRREAKKTPVHQPPTSLFGISCSRQIDANILLYRPLDVTRSTVQKAVVVVTDTPQSVGQLREKLSVVTSAWFAQRDFSDVDILKKFRESLVRSLNSEEARMDQNLGLSLREMIHEFKYQTLVLFKALLLQPKMLFFGSRCERLCMIQFSLISLIPGLLHHLQDCADPAFDSYFQNAEKPTSLKTSERSSMLAYMGLPLQIFGKGSMFGPYTPLQLLDLLADSGTKSYVVGSTNSLLLQQKDRYSDILINLDEDTISVLSPSFRSALSLSAADRRWIDFLTQVINETWDDAHPQRPRTHGYMGSEEFIRLQFEEYLLALLSCMKYHEDLNSFNAGESGHKSRAQLEAFNIEGDPALEFNAEFLTQWQNTPNYALFRRLTSDALLFSIVEPRHPCAGGLTIEDVQRRISQQVAELHLDDRVREGREALGRHFSTGQKKVSAVFNNFWADIDAMRDAQRKRNEEKAAQSASSSIDRPRQSIGSPLLAPADAALITSSPGNNDTTTTNTNNNNSNIRRTPSVDVGQAQASVSAVGQRAGAYLSSWGSWASEKRKEWQEKRASSPSSPPPSTSPSTVTSPSTPTLGSITEISEADRDRGGRCRSVPRSSEDSSSATTAGGFGPGGLSRSGSRRKRWSNMLLRRDSGEFGSYSSLNRKDDEGGSEFETPYPRSPLSREAPVLGEDLENENDEKEVALKPIPATTTPSKAGTGTGARIKGDKASTTNDTEKEVEKEVDEKEVDEKEVDEKEVDEKEVDEEKEKGKENIKETNASTNEQPGPAQSNSPSQTTDPQPANNEKHEGD